MSVSNLAMLSDFARFWYVGKSIFLDRAAAFGFHIAPPSWFTPAFPVEISWLYPPTMGLLAMLFSCIPIHASFWLWRISTLLIAGYLLRQAGLDWLVIVMGLSSPAELQDILGGQNGALTGGLLVSALLLLDTKPRSGGALAGLLCIKPQIALIFPIILLNKGRLSALLSGLAVVMILVVFSIAVEGWQSWIWFMSGARSISAHIYAIPFDKVFPANGCTVFMMARSFHASLPEAWVAQGLSSLVSVLLIWRAWNRPASQIERMALTVCLSVLLTPYGYIYDLVGFSIAMAAMFRKAPDWQKPIFGLLWLFGGYTGTIANLTGHILMPVAAGLGVGVVLYKTMPARPLRDGVISESADRGLKIQ